MSQVTLLVTLANPLCIQVAAALQDRSISFQLHIVEYNQALTSKREMPILLWGALGAGQIAEGSQNCLRLLDSLTTAPNELFPSSESIEMEENLRTRLLQFVMYFNLFDRECFGNCFKRLADQQVGSGLFGWFRRTFLWWAYSADAIYKQIGMWDEYKTCIERSIEPDILSSQHSIRAGLKAELVKLEGRLKWSTSNYLLGTTAPTAADFLLYGLLECLQGDLWIGAPRCYASCLADAEAERVLKWFEMMHSAHHINFRHHRTPEPKIARDGEFPPEVLSILVS